MLSTKLVRTIESHWEEIAARVIREIRRNPEMPMLAGLPDVELREWCQEIVENLGYLLSASKDGERRRRFQVLGGLRFEENVPLHEAVARWQILKDKIIVFAHEQGLAMTAPQLYAEEELDQQVNRFFDLVVYDVVRGYEAARTRAAKWGS